MADNKSYTIVEYFGGDSGYQCGYCKNSTGNFSHGMWSHTMTVQDYQDLIDRGWRRSGKYVYKPILNKTCCPQYTIRCHALKFQPSKSHKKILKKMNKFLSNGDLPKDEGTEGESMVCDVAGPRDPNESCRSEAKCPSICDVQTASSDGPAPSSGPREQDASAESNSTNTDTSVPPTATSGPKPGTGADPDRPPCRKAKDIRKERRLQKEQQRQREEGIAPTTQTKTPPVGQSNLGKSLEEFINENLSEKAAHGLEVRLVRSNPPSPQFKASFDASYQVYKLYQMAIHKDPPEKPSESQVRGPRA